MAENSLISFPKSPRLHTAAQGCPSTSAFVGRQPIFDSSLSVYGYELLYRRASADETAVFTDRDTASAEVALDAFLEFGLDTLVADRRAFINLTRTVLLSGFCWQLPPDRVVLELLEHLPCDDEVMREVEGLAASGYRIALDDYEANDERAKLLPHASIVKVDIESFDAAGLSALTDQFAPHKLDLVAERVETREQFDACRDLGFNLFQGYFFARPATVRGKRVPVERLTALRVLSMLGDLDTPLGTLADAVAGDVKLSYQVLRAVNSAHSAPARTIDSIPDAIMRLGRNQLRAWLSVLALTGIDGKPPAVLTMALTRARMCEALASSRSAASPGSWFLGGLFSTLDVLFDQPLPSLLQGLPLSPQVVEGILNRSGDLGATLNAVAAFERGDWPKVRCGQLTPSDFTMAYRTALQWSREWETAIAAA